jgi:iron complex outermembrane receptor protein
MATIQGGSRRTASSRRKGMKLMFFTTASILVVPVAPAFGQAAATMAPTETAASAPAGAAAVPASPADQQEGAAGERDIVVTGSLVARSGFTTPTPVTTIGAADLARVSAPDISNVINQIPSVRASLTPGSTPNLSSLAGGNYIDLRGLGYQRTQVLLDGRRYVPTTPSGGVSVSSIPQALIRDIDIVTGGASAAYGSDAVAGVVNLRLDDKLEGLKGSVQGGITDHNDFRNFLVSVAVGKTFAGGRAHILIGGEAAQNSGIGRVGDRAWGARNPALISNPAYTPTNSEPRYILTQNVHQSNVSYGGVINSPGLLKGIQFAPDGSAIPFTYGTLVSSSTMVGGDGANTTADGVMAVPVKRYSGLGRLSYKLGEGITAYAQLSYSKVTSRFDGLASTDQITIMADNAYLPQSIRNTMAQQRIGSFVMGRSVLDNSRTINHLNIRTMQALGGFKGNLGSGWAWDAYYSYGHTLNTVTSENSRITSRFNQAIDAVVNPANGSIVCRATLSSVASVRNAAAGCVPLNLIGEGNASRESLAWVNGVAFRKWDITQQEVAGTLRGSPFSTWAGAIQIAVGAEYRKQTIDTTSDPISAAQAFRGGGTIPYSGRVSVKEGFGEVLIPLASGAAWAKDLNIDLAARVTDYSTSGTVETWKAGIDYAISDSVRLRATRSRDIRAPSLEELFAAGSTSSLTVSDPKLGRDYLVTASNTGNRNLTPEKADTLTGGIVLTPTFIPRFSLSVDYYDIKMNNAIISLTPASIVTQCYTTSPEVCSLIDRGADGAITIVHNGPVNLQSVHTRGIDVEAAYSVPVGADHIALRGLVTYIAKATIDNGITVTHLEGSVDQPTIAALGGNPHWRFNTSASYLSERFRLSVTARYIGGGEINTAYTDKDIDTRRVSGRLYFDLSGEVPVYGAGRNKVSLFAAVQNALDNDPPITGVGGYGTTRALYDTIGRLYTAGIRFRF